MPQDLSYIILLFVLFLVPRMLQRFRLPAAITAVGLGIVAGSVGWLQDDSTLALLSSLGIVSLFLFAGLEVDLDEFRSEAPILVQHLVIWLLTLAATAGAAMLLFSLSLRAGILLGLAIVTPSTGFILDSLDRFGLTPAEKRWTKAKAISSELVALALMLVALRSGSVQELAVSILILAVLIVILPPVFRWFAATISPYAPRSEFAFLIMIAMVSAYLTRHLGVYYLVGAFVAGLAARKFRNQLPAMSSERMLGAVEAFASVFIPFYFFRAGQHVLEGRFTAAAALAGCVISVTFIGLRLGEVALHRWLALREPPRRAATIGVALLPTLVFSLVCVELLRDHFIVPEYLLTGVVIYTVLTTVLPGLLLGVPAPSFEEPHLDPLAIPDPARSFSGTPIQAPREPA